MPPRTERIRRVRGQLLTVLKVVYRGSLQAKSVYRSLLAVFPDLQWVDYCKDLAYLQEKGYIARQVVDSEDYPENTDLRERWFRLTAAGVEIADEVIDDPALEV